MTFASVLPEWVMRFSALKVIVFGEDRRPEMVDERELRVRFPEAAVSLPVTLRRPGVAMVSEGAVISPEMEAPAGEFKVRGASALMDPLTRARLCELRVAG